MKYIEMRNIIATWNMINKYNIKGAFEDKSIVYVPVNEYNRLMNSVVNKQYIRNITK